MIIAITIAILLIISFFFSSSETALSAINRIRLTEEAKQRDKQAQKLLDLLQKPSNFITTTLIGNTIANILIPILATIYAEKHDIHIVWAIIIAIVIVLFIGEVIPKSIAASIPYQIAKLSYIPLQICIFIFKPLTMILNGITDSIHHALTKNEESSQRYSKEEIRQMVTIAGSEGAFNEMESKRLQGVMDFEQLKINDVNTTPRINVTAFSKETTYQEAYETVISNPFTRYPVYDEDIDNIIGIFHSKYLLAWSQEQQKQITDYISVPLFVNEHNKAEWALRKMTVTRKHLAVVLDEYGGTDGIVSHEDLIEEMLGMDIEDEMDEEEEEKVSLNRKQSSHNSNT